MRYIFGPVPSRRLGISLGVDIIPFKTCTMNCIYCECGRTTQLATERTRFVDPNLVINELQTALAENPHLDYITFSGSGEPTLNKDLGLIIKNIKELTSIPVAVLTNGALLYLKEVREELLPADLVLPSLDAVSPQVFAKINQPAAHLDIDSIIAGLVEFRKEFKGQIWLEVFIVAGLNDSDDELAGLYKAIEKIVPHRVQLNSLDRPPAYPGVTAVDTARLERIAAGWKDLPIPVDIIQRASNRREIFAFSKNLEHNILNTIKRRPLMIDDLEELTGKKRCEIYKYIDILEKEKKINAKIVGDKIFYSS